MIEGLRLFVFVKFIADPARARLAKAFELELTVVAATRRIVLPQR
jgi:hypothetical protein